jgi:NAD(P)-dependent dehydrogenase (short-subunit alcohol dehydrogenase family)
MDRLHGLELNRTSLLRQNRQSVLCVLYQSLCKDAVFRSAMSGDKLATRSRHADGIGKGCSGTIISKLKYMNTSLKVVVVTGASRGIGAEVVKAFRKLDYRVVATSRAIKPTSDPNILTVAGDIGDRDTARRVISEGIAQFGRIDTLVNNAGIYIGKPFTEHTDEDYVAITNVNLAGFYHITQLAIAEMEKNSGGHVVSVTAGAIEGPRTGMYSVLAALTKGGLNAATRSLAIEYAKKGIRVNAVAPGMMKSPMYPAEMYEALGAFHPIGRMGEMSDIADAILYLDSAPFITGEILHVDGGLSVGF